MVALIERDVGPNLGDLLHHRVTDLAPEDEARLADHAAVVQPPEKLLTRRKEPGEVVDVLLPPIVFDRHEKEPQILDTEPPDHLVARPLRHGMPPRAPLRRV